MCILCSSRKIEKLRTRWTLHIQNPKRNEDAVIASFGFSSESSFLTQQVTHRWKMMTKCARQFWVTTEVLHNHTKLMLSCCATLKAQPPPVTQSFVSNSSRLPIFIRLKDFDMILIMKALRINARNHVHDAWWSHFSHVSNFKPCILESHHSIQREKKKRNRGTKKGQWKKEK